MATLVRVDLDGVMGFRQYGPRIEPIIGGMMPVEGSRMPAPNRAGWKRRFESHLAVEIADEVAQRLASFPGADHYAKERGRASDEGSMASATRVT